MVVKISWSYQPAPSLLVQVRGVRDVGALTVHPISEPVVPCCYQMIFPLSAGNQNFHYVEKHLHADPPSNLRKARIMLGLKTRSL